MYKWRKHFTNQKWRIKVMSIQFDELRHIIYAQQFSRNRLEREFLPLTDVMEIIFNQGGCGVLRGKRMVSFFYEPSTRTRMSFEMAMDYLAAPPDRDLDWQEDGVAGVSRFLGRVWRIVTKHSEFARGELVDSHPSSKGAPRFRVLDDSNADPNGGVKLLRKLHQTDRQDQPRLRRPLALQYQRGGDYGTRERDAGCRTRNWPRARSLRR